MLQLSDTKSSFVDFEGRLVFAIDKISPTTTKDSGLAIRVLYRWGDDPVEHKAIYAYSSIAERDKDFELLVANKKKNH